MKSVKLGDPDIAEVGAGQAAPQDEKNFSSSGHPFIRAGSLEALCSGGTTRTLEHIEPTIAEKFRLKLFPKDTVVFAKSGMSAKIGRIYRLVEPSYVVSHLAAIVPKQGLDPGYLTHFLVKNPPSRLIPNDAYPSIRLSEIENITIELPQPDEQRRIASILDKADAIRRKRQQALKLADDFLQSTYLYLCGEKNSDYSDWPDISLDSLASSMHTGPFGSSLKHSEFIQEGIAVLGIDNAVANRFEWRERRFITEEKYAELKRYTAKAGDVIVTIMGTIGRSAVVPDDIPTAISTKHLATIRVDRKQAIPQYISQAIHRDPNLLRQIKQAGKGAIMTGLNLGIIKCLHIRCAPIEQQKKFAAVVSNVNNYIEKILKSSEHEALFSGLCQNFFSK